METQVWSKVEEKFANILTLRGTEVHRLKVTGSMLTLKRNIRNVMEKLEQGESPADVGAKVLGTLDARSITKAELSPGNGSLTLHGGGTEGGIAPTSIKYATGASDADQILTTILAQSGQSFQPTQEEIGVVEALVGPGFVGLIGGIFWFLLYNSATKLAAGESVEVSGRREGMQRMLVMAADMVGPTGALAIGIIFFLLIAFWAFRQITRRPMRTVLTPTPV